MYTSVCRLVNRLLRCVRHGASRTGEGCSVRFRLHFVAGLRAGDWAEIGGGEHRVAALVGATVRLCSYEGAEQVVLITQLISSAGFAVIGADPVTAVEPFGLLDSLPSEALMAVRAGAPCGRSGDRAAAGYRPGRSLPRRLCPCGLDGKRAGRSQGRRVWGGCAHGSDAAARYDWQGLWGLADQRTAREHAVTGRVDSWVVTAVREARAAETDASMGTRSRLMRRVAKKIENEYGPGVWRCRRVQRFIGSSTRWTRSRRREGVRLRGVHPGL